MTLKLDRKTRKQIGRKIFLRYVVFGIDGNGHRWYISNSSCAIEAMEFGYHSFFRYYEVYNRKKKKLVRTGDTGIELRRQRLDQINRSIEWERDLQSKYQIMWQKNGF